MDFPLLSHSTIPTDGINPTLAALGPAASCQCTFHHRTSTDSAAAHGQCCWTAGELPPPTALTVLHLCTYHLCAVGCIPLQSSTMLAVMMPTHPARRNNVPLHKMNNTCNATNALNIAGNMRLAPLKIQKALSDTDKGDLTGIVGSDTSALFVLAEVTATPIGSRKLKPDFRGRWLCFRNKRFGPEFSHPTSREPKTGPPETKSRPMMLAD